MYFFLKAIFHKIFLNIFSFGKPDIRKINFVLNSNNISSISGKEVIK